jgi:hypothetical protein
MQHFLFGYGSLINADSRRITGETGHSAPVRVSGLQRSWNVTAPDMKMAGVGVTAHKSATCNGVLVTIQESEIPVFDEREIVGTDHSYDRMEIPLGNIKGFAGHLDAKSKVWVYLVKKPVIPTTEYPIAQSYVDVVLTGCLAFGEEFAVEFIRTTTGWEYPWYEDRNAPRYVRPLQRLVLREKIDELLAQYTTIAFSNRKNLAA